MRCCMHLDLVRCIPAVQLNVLHGPWQCRPGTGPVACGAYCPCRTVLPSHAGQDRAGGETLRAYAGRALSQSNQN